MSSSLFVGQARLIALHGDVQPPEYLLETDSCTIGRSSHCDVIVVRPTVSRLHARIERRGSHFVLHDLSRNLTFVNEVPVDAPHVLRDRETMGFALPEPLLLFQDSDPTAEPHPSRLRYDEKRMAFWLDDRRLSLTRLELRLLYHLYRNAGQLCAYEDCGRATWLDNYSSYLLVENLGKIVYRVRKKLRQIDPNCDLIETRRGVGFILRD